MATNKTTVSVYADDDLLAALNEFKDSGKHKSLNVAIVAILREKLFGEGADNVQSNLQGKVSSTLDIESMINDSVTSAIANLRASINDELVDLKMAIAPLLANTAPETATSEASVPANFTPALLHKAMKVAPLMLQKSA